MIRSRLGLKALGLCALVVGVMSMSAGAAQAQPNSKWFFNGAQLAEALKPELQATLENSMGSLLTVLGGKNIHILCTALKLVGATIFNTKELKEGGQTLGKIDFSGCKFFELVVAGGATKEIPACEPIAEGVKGLIVSNFVKGLIELHEPSAGVKEGFVKFTPDPPATLFTTISLGEECAFGSELRISGSVGLKDCNKEFTVEKVTHLVEPVLQALIVNGGASATLDGSANVSLAGAHVGKTWSGKPA